MENVVTESAVNSIVRELLEQQVAAGEQVGIQVAAYHRGELIVDCWAGTVAPGSARKVDGDTLFNVFSVSKAIADVALAIQIERGAVELDAPVARYWPEYGANGKAATTVADVLYHRAGVPHLPEDVTPERLGDWEWMTTSLAELEPIFEPGTRTAYQCISQGWMLGEIVRRTDPAKRSYRQFVIDEIATPLRAPDLHHGIPDDVEDRIATLHEPDKTDYFAKDSLFRRSIPIQVDLGPVIWERPDVRRAVVPSTGGIFTARSEARFFAMLAEGGELDGVRILKQSTVASFLEPVGRAPMDDGPDPVIMVPFIPLGKGGIWHGTDFQPALPAGNARTLIKPGYGHSVNIADIDNRLGIAICHNLLFNPHTREQCRNTPIINAIRDAVGASV